jgi:predicted DNA-binding transcriptional regulator AlpA
MTRQHVLPVGVAEISERLGVRQQTVAQWKLRGLLPPPRWTVSRQAAWNWQEIEAWAQQRKSLALPDAYIFRLYLSLDGVTPEAVEPALTAAGAELPIRWAEHRTLVTFCRSAPSYSEAVTYAVNQLPIGVAASGVQRPLL